MKQTAVEWVLNELRAKMGYGNNLGKTAQIIFDVITCEAKAMEKEQMKKIYSSPIMKNEDGNLYAKSFEQYYNETYGK